MCFWMMVVSFIYQKTPHRCMCVGFCVGFVGFAHIHLSKLLNNEAIAFTSSLLCWCVTDVTIAMYCTHNPMEFYSDFIKIDALPSNTYKTPLHLFYLTIDEPISPMYVL